MYTRNQTVVADAVPLLPGRERKINICSSPKPGGVTSQFSMRTGCVLRWGFSSPARAQFTTSDFIIASIT